MTYLTQNTIWQVITWNPKILNKIGKIGLNIHIHNVNILYIPTWTSSICIWIYHFHNPPDSVIAQKVYYIQITVQIHQACTSSLTLWDSMPPVCSLVLYLMLNIQSLMDREYLSLCLHDSNFSKRQKFKCVKLNIKHLDVIDMQIDQDRKIWARAYKTETHTHTHIQYSLHMCTHTEPESLL